MTDKRSPREMEDLGLLANTMTALEAAMLLADRLDELAHELELAAQHKNNPGSTNGTVAQVANALRQIVRGMREGAKS